MKDYNYTDIEKKWQKYWDEHQTFHAENDYSKPKFYALVEFPYPSGQGLHIGHPRPWWSNFIPDSRGILYTFSSFMGDR